MLNAGNLTARIQIQRDLVTMHSGAETRVPSTVYTIWAQPEALIGQEAWRAQQINDKAQWRFTVRYEWRGKILPSDRVIHMAVSYEILAILPDDVRRDCLVLLCMSVNG